MPAYESCVKTFGTAHGTALVKLFLQSPIEPHSDRTTSSITSEWRSRAALSLRVFLNNPWSPVQRYSTLAAHTSPRHFFSEAVWQTLRSRGGGAEHGVGVGCLNDGRDVGDVVRQEGPGRCAALAVLREVSGAGKPRLIRPVSGYM